MDGLWNMYYIVDNMYLLRNIYYNVKVCRYVSPASIMTPPNMNLWKENMMLY